MSATSTAVFIPALNEQATVQHAVTIARSARVGPVYLVDGGSTDDTINLAAEAGAEVLNAAELLPDLGEVRGKGDSWFRFLHTAGKDHQRAVAIDSDLQTMRSTDVAALANSLDAQAGLLLVKASFDRLDRHGRPRPLSGGRVTDLVARPLLEMLCLKSGGLRQPLSGQICVDVAMARELRTYTGYGLELGMLMQVELKHGYDTIGECSIGDVINGVHSDNHLSGMANEVLATGLHCAELGQLLSLGPRLGKDPLEKAGVVVRH